MQHPKLMALVYWSKSSRSDKIWGCSLYASFSFGDTCIDGPKVLPVKWNQHFFHLSNCQARLFPHSSLRKRLEKLCPCLATVFIPPPCPPPKQQQQKQKQQKSQSTFSGLTYVLSSSMSALLGFVFGTCFPTLVAASVPYMKPTGSLPLLSCSCRAACLTNSSVP